MEKNICLKVLSTVRFINEKRGGSGFGYDPIFVPDTYSETFAEMGNDIKNQISHRAEAVKKLTAFLSDYTF